MTINVIGRPPRKELSLFHLFGVVSGMFQPFLACYGLLLSFHFSQATTSQNVLTCKFTIKKLHVDFITKDSKRHYKVRQLKIRQVLKTGTGITKWDNFYLKVGQ